MNRSNFLYRIPSRAAVLLNKKSRHIDIANTLTWLAKRMVNLSKKSA